MKAFGTSIKSATDRFRGAANARSAANDTPPPTLHTSSFLFRHSTFSGGESIRLNEADQHDQPPPSPRFFRGRSRELRTFLTPTLVGIRWRGIVDL